jgi:hypothetical protein
LLLAKNWRQRGDVVHNCAFTGHRALKNGLQPLSRAMQDALSLLMHVAPYVCPYFHRWEHSVAWVRRRQAVLAAFDESCSVCVHLQWTQDGLQHVGLPLVCGSWHDETFNLRITTKYRRYTEVVQQVRFPTSLKLNETSLQR